MQGAPRGGAVRRQCPVRRTNPNQRLHRLRCVGVASGLNCGCECVSGGERWGGSFDSPTGAAPTPRPRQPLPKNELTLIATSNVVEVSWPRAPAQCLCRCCCHCRRRCQKSHTQQLKPHTHPHTSPHPHCCRPQANSWSAMHSKAEERSLFALALHSPLYATGL